MTKENLLSLIRTILTLIGSYLVGHAFLGGHLTDEVWQTIGGAIMTLIGTIWGILDKSVGVEQAESGFRSAGIALGGILVAAGKISNQTLESFLALGAAIIPFILSSLGKAKLKQIDSGKIDVNAKGKSIAAVAPVPPPTTPPPDPSTPKSL